MTLPKNYSSFYVFLRNFAPMINKTTRTPRTIIRIGRQTLAFALPVANESTENSPISVVHTLPMLKLEPYTVKSGMSMAANLREAFHDSVILSVNNTRAQVLIDSPVMLIPLEEYEESEVTETYHYTYPGHEMDTIETYVMHDLNSVAVFSINKDVRMVITDHFDDVRITPLHAPVWQHLHPRSYSGVARKLYAYVHEGMMDVFSFAKNRFRYQNNFTAKETADLTYFLLYIWQTLAFDVHKDELYLVGDSAVIDALRDEVKKYVQNVFVINPSTEFNRAPMTQLPHITYDMICLCE